MDGLEHDADRVPAHVAIVHVAWWTLEIQLEAEALDVVGDRGLQVLHDEERTDGSEVHARGVIRFSHRRAQRPVASGVRYGPSWSEARRVGAPANRCTLPRRAAALGIGMIW